MKDRVDPHFEFQRGPVLWAGAATIMLSAAAMFVIGRPSWILPIAFVAGCIAAGAGGFYDAHANNGLFGVVVAIIPLYVFVVLYRVLFSPDPITAGDTIFIGLTLAVMDLIVYIPAMLVFGYLGGIVGDHLRRRIDGPIGY